MTHVWLIFFSKNGGLIDVYFIYLPVFHGVN